MPAVRRSSVRRARCGWPPSRAVSSSPDDAPRQPGRRNRPSSPVRDSRHSSRGSNSRIPTYPCGPRFRSGRSASATPHRPPVPSKTEVSRRRPATSPPASTDARSSHRSQPDSSIPDATSLVSFYVLLIVCPILQRPQKKFQEEYSPSPRIRIGIDKAIGSSKTDRLRYKQTDLQHTSSSRTFFFGHQIYDFFPILTATPYILVK